ncbi:MAG: DUF4124 domain-containing protein [Xanthomonadales bacterium]|nr:DUF4124 domain-containing protein [Xanthomonadales bacterium]
MTMELKPTRRGALAGLLALLLSAGTGAAEVYRWVDDEGNVHYSQSLPPDFEDKGHDVLNSSGLIIDKGLKLTPEPQPELPSKDEPQELPRDSSGMPRPKALYSEAELQQRLDSFLRLRYSSEQEIHDAMEVEIKQLAYDRKLLENSRKSLMTEYSGQVKAAGNHQRAGTEVDPDLLQKIERLHAQLSKNARSIEGLRERENKIRADFEEQLDRYRYLVEHQTEDS